MQVRTLLPDTQALQCEEINYSKELITISVSSTSPTAACPGCGGFSSRVHSRYWRKLVDLPWHGVQVRIQWRNRRFFCDRASCSRRIFAERLSNVAPPWAHQTQRLQAALRAIGFACGGEEGARLAERLGISISPDTLLRTIRRTLMPRPPAPQVVGVDDWAFCRGKRYGTILCDLERHRPLDLLPERSSEAFACWLTAHREVRVISRDRGDYFIKGATAGAPQAVQVVDRWHLLHNLREALVRLVDRHFQHVLAAARIAATEKRQEPGIAMRTDTDLVPTIAPPKLTRSQQRAQMRRARRLQRYQHVMQLHHQGVSYRAVAVQLGMHRRTVRRYVHAGAFPERATRRYYSRTDRFLEYLHCRWNEGCHNARRLLSELEQQGFDGSYDMVRRRVARWRTKTRAPPTKARRTGDSHRSPMRHPSSSEIAWLLLKPPLKQTPQERLLVCALYRQSPSLKTASELARRFARIVHDRQQNALDRWLTRAQRSHIAMELRRFARGLEYDLGAVRCALSLPWSNGQTEGHVNRLKLIKRQMYGRANFDLLRQRFLYPG